MLRLTVQYQCVASLSSVARASVKFENPAEEFKEVKWFVIQLN